MPIRPTIRPGDMQYFVTIEKPDPVLNDAGQSQGWVEFAKCHVYLETMGIRDRETVSGNLLQSAVKIIAHMWYLPGLTPAMRIRTDDGRVLNILAVIDVDNVHAVHEAPCIEVQ